MGTRSPGSCQLVRWCHRHPGGHRGDLHRPPRIFPSYSAPSLAPPWVNTQCCYWMAGLINADAASHATFHGARWQAYGQLIQDLTLEHAAAWQAGHTLRMHSRHASPVDGDHPHGDIRVRAPDRVHVFEHTVIAYFQAFTTLLLDGLPMRRNFGGFGPWSRFKAIAARLEQLLNDEIRARRQQDSDGDTTWPSAAAATTMTGHDRGGGTR